MAEKKNLLESLGSVRSRVRAEQNAEWEASLAEANRIEAWPEIKHDGQRRFLIALSFCGSTVRASEFSGHSRRSYWRWCEHDEAFRLALNEAKAIAIERLEEECRRRAEEGVVKTTPIYFQGHKVGEKVERVYSDLLLMFLLKGLAPEKYRERSDIRIADNAADLAAGTLTDEQLAEIRDRIYGSGVGDMPGST
jgi:hypothetical protein